MLADRLARFIAAAVLVLVAASTPVMGYAAGEQHSGRRFSRILEGDWLFLFALIAGVSCLWGAGRVLRSPAKD